MTVYEKLIQIQDSRKAGYLVLLDPDKKSPAELAELAKTCESQGVDGLLIGGSLLLSPVFDEAVKAVKESVSIPVILFPGNGMQLSPYADALFFMSLISGRNPHALIGEQVHAAPLVRAMKLEPISMGYMLIESGSMTSAEFMSNTKPIPREKPGIAVAHGLAAEYLGMKFLYLEGGSGAKLSVPESMIRAVSSHISIPLIVGGGIHTPEQAEEKVKAGAAFIVTGNLMENEKNHSLITLFAEAVHQTVRP